MLVLPFVSLGLLSMMSSPVEGVRARQHSQDATTPVEIQSALALSAGPPIAAGASVYVTSRDVGTEPGAPCIGEPGTARALMIVVPGSSSQSDSHAP
jgi:hypothetical protein